MSSLQSTTPPATTEGGLVSAATLATQLANNPDNLVVDVRTPAELASGHIRSAINLPLDQVDAHLRRIVTDAGGRLVLVCQSGGRATQAYDKLTAAGLDDVEVLDGGMNAWIAAGAETDVSGDPDQWTIERQVRLVAGRHRRDLGGRQHGLVTRQVPGGRGRRRPDLRRVVQHLRDGHAARPVAVQPCARERHRRSPRTADRLLETVTPLRAPWYG